MNNDLRPIWVPKAAVSIHQLGPLFPARLPKSIRLIKTIPLIDLSIKFKARSNLFGQHFDFRFVTLAQQKPKHPDEQTNFEQQMVGGRLVNALYELDERPFLVVNRLHFVDEGIKLHLE